MTRIVADIKDKDDAEVIYRVIKQFKANVKIMNDAEWEDFVLGRMAEEAETEGGTMPREKIAKKFKRHGIEF